MTSNGCPLLTGPAVTYPYLALLTGYCRLSRVNQIPVDISDNYSSSKVSVDAVLLLTFIQAPMFEEAPAPLPLTLIKLQY